LARSSANKIDLVLAADSASSSSVLDGDDLTGEAENDSDAPAEEPLPFNGDEYLPAD